MYNIMTDSFHVRKEEEPTPIVVPTKVKKAAKPEPVEDDEELRGFLDGTLKYDPDTDSLSKVSIDDEL